jgi:hypothetical protein
MAMKVKAKSSLIEYHYFGMQLIAFLMAFAIASPVESADLYQTGQITCYDSEGEVIPCGGTGQDGDIRAGAAWPNPRFTGSGDCVTDNLTGLMWVRRLDTASRTWQQALDYAKALTLCGYDDWRLPNRKELRSLINYEEIGSGLWLSGQGFSNVQNETYWTSTSYVHTTDSAWFIDIFSGVMFFDFKTKPLYVWPVRGGPVD